MLIQRYKYQDMVFWAEHGLIKMEDQRDGDYKVLTRKEALLRARHINDEIAYTKHGDEREALHSLVQNLIDCVKTAKEQGDPMDHNVRSQIAKDIKRSRRAKILLPGGSIPELEISPLTAAGIAKPKITAVSKIITG